MMLLIGFIISMQRAMKKRFYALYDNVAGIGEKTPQFSTDH